MFVYFLLIVGVGSAFAHVCDVCGCEPSRDNVFSISCSCNVTNNLQFTEAMMKGVESAAIVMIKNCDSVDVGRSSFSKLNSLETLHVQNCQKLHLSPGAFSTLHSLLVNNVKDVSFDEMALMGARGIKKILISSSGIAALPKYSLYDVKDLDVFSLNNVTVRKIASSAFNISAKSINIENSQINYVEANGIVLRAEKLLLKNSSFIDTSAGSLDLRTKFHTRFLDNDFGGLLQANIASPFVEFARNRFSGFNTTNLYNVESALFMNNTILDADVASLLSLYDDKSFHDNRFECRCGMNLANKTQHSKNYEILRKNYCSAECEYSLFEFEVDFLGTCQRGFEADVADACRRKRIKQREEAGKPNNEPNVRFRSRFLGGDSNETFLHMGGNSTEERLQEEEQRDESSNAPGLFTEGWLLVFVAMLSVWR